MLLDNIMNDGTFWNSVTYHKLVMQFCCEDPELQYFLKHIRVWKPTQPILNSIKETRLLSNGQPSDEVIINALNVGVPYKKDPLW